MKQSRATRIRLLMGPIMVLFLLILGVLLLSTVQAEGLAAATSTSVETGDDDPSEGSAGVSAINASAWEVGVHHSAAGWMNAHASAEGWALYSKLGSCGWDKRYRYGNKWAWEEDFKRSSRGGTEYRYLDTVDLQFYVGHGGPSGFTFANTSHDDAKLTPADCYRSWGNGDNEWVALTSCQVLDNENLSRWAKCMRGTHLILGFKTNAEAHLWPWSTQGYHFARYLCKGYKVAQAWYKAADRSQSQQRVVRVLANELACLNDRPKTGWVCADSYDWDWWVRSHRAGSEPPRPVDLAAVGNTMPVFLTPPLSLAEAEAQYDRLATVFEVTPSVRLQQDGDPIWTDEANGRELEMDSQSGLYGYTDLNNLWTYTETQAALLSPGAVITSGQAISIAERFLRDNGLMAADAQFYEVVSDTISGGDILSGTLEAENASLLEDEQAVVWQVIYSRILTYTPTTVAGVAQAPLEFSVVGPGAKQMAYVSTGSAEMRNGLSGNGSDVLGVVGGWRGVEDFQRGQGAGVAQTVEILTQEQIYTLHQQLADQISLNPPPTEADGTTILSHTLAYWEQGLGMSQSELYPVYALNISYTLGITDMAVDYAYIPANPLYMPPYAQIESAPSGLVKVGQTVVLTATEASRTLADLGYDPTLDFALGSGAPEDYIYAWYANSLDDANLIGTGRSIQYEVAYDVTARIGIPVQTILLKVTDITNPDSTSSTDSWVLNLYPRVYLPLVFRNSP
jgi:hypothetical protein